MSSFLTRLQNISQNTFSSFYIRNYRLYYLGQIISTSGTWMQTVAQAWLVLQLTNSGTALGVLAALQYLPILLLGPYGGVIADRFSKRKILFITQSISGILALILGTLVATGVVRVWMVDILAFCLGVTNVFDNPARQTFYMEMVGPEKLRNAVTLYSILINLARTIGPALAAALIAAAGLALCFILNGVSFLAVIIMLAMMRPGELHVTPPIPRARGQLREGFKYVVSTPVVASILLMMAFIGTFTFEFQVSLPLIVEFTFHGDASSYAYLTSAIGAGAALGGLILAGRKAVTPHRLVYAALLFGGAVLLASLMPTLLLAGLAMVVVGVCAINFSSQGNSTLQLYSDPQMRGRVMSFWTVCFLGSTTFGGPMVGWFAGVAGARWGLALGGIAALVAAGLGMLTLRGAKDALTTALRPGEQTVSAERKEKIN